MLCLIYESDKAQISTMGVYARPHKLFLRLKLCLNSMDFQNAL